MVKSEKNLLSFLKKNYKIIFFVFITLSALFVRIRMLDYRSGDYEICLNNWFDNLKQNGGLKGLSSYIGDYAPPYMTIMALLTYLPISSLYSIKFVSIFFDFTLALSSAILVKNLVKKDKNVYFILTYLLVLFIPSVLLNGAFWGQCDSMYATFIVLSLILLVKEKYTPSFIFLGLAFSFKLQFIFVLPVYIILYVTKNKFSILNFLIIPLTYIVLCVPSMIMGKPLTECLMVYFSQTSTYKSELVLNFINIYNIFKGDPSIFYTVGEIITLVVCASALFWVLYKKIKFNSEKILLIATWFPIMMTFLLPGMHDRYLFVGEVLSIIYFIVYKKHGFIALFINICALITYSNYLTSFRFEYMDLLSIVAFIIYVIYTRNIILDLEENKEKKR